MVIEYIRYKVSENRRVEFIQAYQSASKQLLDSEFCLGYELTHCQEEADHFIMRIEWTSTEDHLNGFRKTPEFREFFNWKEILMNQGKSTTKKVKRFTDKERGAMKERAKELK